MLRKKEEVHTDLFPKGGTHWNELGAFYGTKAIVNKVAQLTHNDKLQLQPIDYEMKEPQGQDADLNNLLNVWKVGKDYLVPILNIKEVNMKEKEKLKWLIVGDSFSWKINDILWQANIVKGLKFLRYYDEEVNYIPKNKNLKYPKTHREKINKLQINFDTNILSNDVIILSYVEAHLYNHEKFVNDLLSYYDYKSGKNFYEAVIDVDESSIQVKPGQKLSIPVTVKNISTAGWPIGKQSKIKLGARLFRDNNKIFEVKRIEFNTSTMPNEIKKVKLEFTCPKEEGVYDLNIDMIDEGKGWFSSKGSLSKDIKIIVNKN